MGRRIVRAACTSPAAFALGSRAFVVCVTGSRVYETVKKKEAERRRDAASSAEPRFADVLKEQWEARKKEMAAEAQAQATAAKSAG